MEKEMWEELEDDGATYSCAIVTYFGKEWRCPEKATKALRTREYDRLVKLWSGNIVVRHRAMCETHQKMAERDFL